MLTASEIFDSIRIKVRTGEIAPGEVLPPVRRLAEQLDVNRNTVASAYKKLVAAGIAVTNGRNGTTILGLAQPLQQEGAVAGSVLCDVSAGNPYLPALPDITALTAAVLATPRTYGDAVINDGLLRYGERWLQADAPGEFGLNLTHGAVDAIERLITGYLSAGEAVAVEEPCFLSSINTIRSLGYRPLGIAVDRQGICPQPLRAALEGGAQAVIITPRAHNPTGCSLSAQRAQEIQRVLGDFPHVLVVIDDHFSLLSGQPYYNAIPPTTAHWAIVRSFAKFLGPDLRMALVAGNPQTSQRLSQRLASGTSWVSHILQDMAQQALTSAEGQRTIAAAGAHYRQRNGLLLAELQRHGVACSAEYDGLNVWLALRQPADELVTLMMRRGWLLRPGQIYSLGQDNHAVRLTPAALDEQQVAALAADLADALRQCGNALTA